MKPFLIHLFVHLVLLAPVMSQTPTFDWQGHRGCRGLMPENTIPAFLKALELGVNTLELDVVISKDRQVVVSHEPYFNPAISTAPSGQPVPKGSKINLYEMAYADIKSYDVGARGNAAFADQQKLPTYKPLLTEVIKAAEEYRKKNNLANFGYNIELKSEANEYDKWQPQPAVFCDLVYDVIAQMLPSTRVTVQSFDFNILKHWKKQTDAGAYKKLTLAALVSNLKGIEKNIKDLGFQPDIYSPFYKLLNPKKVKQLHALGIKVIPWTVNTTPEMQKLRAMGVDGIITDYPNRIPK